MHQIRSRGLEITFRQFCLNQQTPQLQVDLRSILRAAFQRDPRSETQSWAGSLARAQEGNRGPAGEASWIAKDIHQQRIGAVGAFQFATGAIAASGNKPGAGIDLGEARSPIGLLENSLVGGGEKVAVCPSLVLAVDHAGYGAIGHLCAQVGCPQGIAVTQFAPQSHRADGKWSSLHSSSIGENKAKIIPAENLIPALKDVPVPRQGCGTGRQLCRGLFSVVPAVHHCSRSTLAGSRRSARRTGPPRTNSQSREW